MAITYFPFDAGAGSGVTESQWAAMAKLWRVTGVVDGFLNEFEVYADSSGMQVKVKSGSAWIEGHYIASSAEEVIALSAADPADDRIDRIVLRVDWLLNTMEIAVLEGAPAGVPVPIAVTQTALIWEISLAQVLVDSGAVTIAAGKVTDERTIVATPEYVPDATTALKGKVELATAAETEAKSSSTLVVTPAGMKGIVHILGGLISNPQAMYIQRPEIPIFRTPAAITVTRIHIHGSDLTPTSEMALDLKHADDINIGGYANAAVIDVCDTTNGVVTIVAGFDDATVPANKYIYLKLDSSPHADWKDFYFEMYFTYD